MGQVFQRLQYLEEEFHRTKSRSVDSRAVTRFPDLNQLPPELGLLILSKLDATDLCLAGCVWNNLAADEFLWQGLCLKQYGPLDVCTSIKPPTGTFKQLYLLLDEATLTFNADHELGYKYLKEHNLISNEAEEMAKFLHFGRNVDPTAVREFLWKRTEVIDHLVPLQNFKNQFLPNALRTFFSQTHPPNERGTFLHQLVDKFSERFCQCNPALGLRKDAVYVACFSLILLSVDLGSPHVKNKMSKREFIKNTRHAADDINEDFAGHLYDNVYLRGHIAPGPKY